MLGPEYEKAMQAAIKLNKELGLSYNDGSVIAWMEDNRIILRIWLYHPERFKVGMLPKSFMGYETQIARKPVFHAC